MKIIKAVSTTSEKKDYIKGNLIQEHLRGYIDMTYGADEDEKPALINGIDPDGDYRITIVIEKVSDQKGSQ